MSGAKTNVVKEDTEASLDADKEVGLETNTEKPN
jgi:hypothetical protein